MKKIAIAVAALTLGLGAYALPAFAQADDYGQHVYTQNSQSRFSPDGLAVAGGDEAGARDFGSRDTGALYDSIDNTHRRW